MTAGAVRVVRGSTCGVVCVAVGRGYLDDPAACSGLAHLYEHLWFACDPPVPALAWGETREHAVLLYHACPPDEIGAVAGAVARRLRDGLSPSARQVAAALRTIGLECRTGRERRPYGFPRHDIARALRRDPAFDPVAVVIDGLDLPSLAEEIARFPGGHPSAVCAAGPTGCDLATMTVAAADRPMLRLEGRWEVDSDGGAAQASAWVLPRTAEVAAAAWITAELLDRRPRSAGLRWVSGRVVAPRGVSSLRGGYLYGVASGAAPPPLCLLEEVVLPALRATPGQLDLARQAVLSTRLDVADLAAIDALDLLEAQAGARHGHEDVLAAVERIDAERLRRFADLLGSTSRAEIRTRPARR
ncbi:hypothetical protein [Nonomuraea sp. NPDC050643]|uniref:hypothetical protein n=1 Tax=Nonomuraea sp. NPDC050643 TaxID=3155660 RepID=UPI0033F80DF2